MDELNFDRDDQKKSKFGWVKFSDTVIPFITDENAKMLVR
jgi:hypothetical protein